MAETRAITAMKEATAREIEDAVVSKLQLMIEANANLQNQKIDQSIADMFSAVKLMMKNTVDQTMNGEEHRRGDSPVVSATPVTNHDQTTQNMQRNQSYYSGLTRLARIDFPRFDGSKLKEWITKVEQFFDIDKTPEESKVGIASLHFENLASTWHQALMQEDEDRAILRDWRAYKSLLRERFEEILDDPMAELKELKETEGIAEYHARFELIRSRLKMSEEYLTSAYLAGLRMDTQMHIRMFRPENTRQCLILGRLYEKAHPRKAISGSWSNVKHQTSSVMQKGLLPLPRESTVSNNVEARRSNENGPPLRKFLTSAEMSERRAKGLCYYCDEKYTRDHYLKHKKSQLFMMEFDEMEEEGSDDENQEVEVRAEQDVAQISINAISGHTDYTTMRVRGTHGKKSLYILIDSGSTHNFMDQKVAQMLACKIEPSLRSKVAVADGSRIEISGRISKFKWYFQNHLFQDDMMVIPLGCHDMVLGVQWLQKLGPITWDFHELEMKFKWENKKITLHGIKQGSVREVKAKRIENTKENDIQLHMIYTYEEEDKQEMTLNVMETQEKGEAYLKPVEVLIEEFKDIFEEPTELPPFRLNHNHKIQLAEGSNPVNQKPY